MSVDCATFQARFNLLISAAELTQYFLGVLSHGGGAAADFPRRAAETWCGRRLPHLAVVYERAPGLMMGVMAHLMGAAGAGANSRCPMARP